MLHFLLICGYVLCISTCGTLLSICIALSMGG